MGTVGRRVVAKGMVMAVEKVGHRAVAIAA